MNILSNKFMMRAIELSIESINNFCASNIVYDINRICNVDFVLLLVVGDAVYYIMSACWR